MASTSVLGIAALAAAGIWFLNRPDDRVTTTEPHPATTMRATTTTSPPTELEVIRAAKAAIWRVEVSGCDMEGFGTAWALDDRHLVTNGHVVEIDSYPTLRSTNGEIVEASVIGRSMEPDLAVLQVDRPLAHHLDWADTADLEEGQRLVALGFPVPGTEFATNPGTLVSFQVEGTTRVALRTDAALDRGNSGGPMITGSGRVAGVVTRMAENEGGFQNVPLAFTADALLEQTRLMIAEPTEPEPDCSRAERMPRSPDESWDDWEVEPWDWDLPDPEPYIPPTYPEYTTTTEPCPTGKPSIEITNVDSALMFEYSDGRQSLDISITGRVTNNASATIYVWNVDVLIDGDPNSPLVFLDNHILRSGESARFEATKLGYQLHPGPEEPSYAADFDWDWDDYDLQGCGTR